MLHSLTSLKHSILLTMSYLSKSWKVWSSTNTVWLYQTSVQEYYYISQTQHDQDRNTVVSWSEARWQYGTYSFSILDGNNDATIERHLGTQEHWRNRIHKRVWQDLPSRSDSSSWYQKCTKSNILATFSLIWTIFVDDKSALFTSIEQLCKGILLIQKLFTDLGMEMHIGKQKFNGKTNEHEWKASNTECIFFPLPCYFNQIVLESGISKNETQILLNDEEG